MMSAPLASALFILVPLEGPHTSLVWNVIELTGLEVRHGLGKVRCRV